MVKLYSLLKKYEVKKLEECNKDNNYDICINIKLQCREYVKCNNQ